mmetsp:Transcript_10437/g.28495  ORF Transcript_10437/g.28495 Transcript_10437/m.28495 type:complete len:626 (+) Transcript_10437:2369-4246(+)
MALWSTVTGSLLGAGKGRDDGIGAPAKETVHATSPTSTLDNGGGAARTRGQNRQNGQNGQSGQNRRHVRHSDASEATTTDSSDTEDPSSLKKDNLCAHLTPTRAEFSRPFSEYMGKYFAEHPDCPCVRVTPPPGYQPRKKSLDLESLRIKAPIKQHVFGRSGAYMALLEEQREMTAAQYEVLANKKDRQPPNRVRQNDKDVLMERSFWSGVTLNPPIYGADTVMSLFDDKVSFGWNLRDLGCLWKAYNVPQIGGVTTPMTYFGMWKAFFAWHKEDLDLYSINYLHTGAPKVWYCVPPSESDKFDAMARQLFPELAADCSQFLRHKNVLISPSLLRTFNIQYVQVVQQPGDFIVINAQAYHSGYNLGYNIAEAVNFALEDWLEIGRDCDQCHCGALDEGVNLDMSIFFPGMYESEEESEEEEEEEDGGSDDGDDSDDSDDGDDGDMPAEKSKFYGNAENADDPAEEEAQEERTRRPAAKKRPRAKRQAPAPRPSPALRPTHPSRKQAPTTPVSLPREARHVTWGSVVDAKPMALVTDTDEGTSFTLVHRLERPASRPDSAWFGVLEKNEDGLYVPKGETTLVQFGGDNSPKLVDVRVQWTCPETRRRGAWKLRRSSVKERNWAERG